jgi:DNA-binding transcriptional LysR family regulator
MVEAGAGVAVVPSFVRHACAKRHIAMHRLVNPEVCGDIYWLVNGTRELPAGSAGFNAFLRDHIESLACEGAMPPAQAA